MATRFTNIRFFSQYVNGDDFSLNTSDFSRVLVGSIGDKIRAILQFTYSQKSTATSLNEMTISGNTITNTIGDFIADGFKVDDVIEFYNDQTGSAEITGRTITAITSNTITFDGAAYSPSTTFNNGRLLLTSQQTGLKLKYNLIENSETPNYVSKVDGTAENYFYADGITVTPQNMTPVNGVKSWQTEEDVTVQFVTQKTVVDDYEQVFEIIHDFTILPFYLDGELTNLQNNVKPALFDGFNSLRYICEADLGLDLLSVDGTRLVEGSTDSGSVGWFDENKNGLAPIYSYSSASYQDTDTTSTVPGIQVNRQTTCSVIISASASVFDTNHRVQLMIANSVGSGDYQQNNNNIFENFVSERLIKTVSDPAVSGTIITDFDCTVLSPTSLQVDFKVEYSVSQQSVVDGLNNIVWITLHDDGVSNKLTDRVAVLVPTQQNYKSADEPNLVFVTNHEFFPQQEDVLGTSYTDVKGWKEDTYITKMNIDLNTDESVLLKRLEVKLGVYNPTDESIFILDKAPYVLSPVVVVGTTQQFNISADRGFQLPLTSDRNKQVFTYKGQGLNGSINVAQYTLLCPMRLRYEDWIPLVTADPSFYDVNEPNDGLNMDSSRYDVAPFEVVTIVDMDVESQTKQTSNYQFISPAFQVEDYDEDGNSPARWPGVVTLEDGSGNQISVIDPDNDTVVKATFTKDASGDSISNEWGRLRMYQPNTTFKQPIELSTFETPKSNQILKPLAGETQLKITNVADVITLEGLIDKNFVSSNDNWYISARIGGTYIPTCPAEALAFISAHETATGLTMAATQKDAVCQLVKNLQGTGTTNGTNIWSTMVSRDARMWIFAPSNDSTISFAGSNIDLITATTKGTFNNFVGGDLTVNGLTGGATKYFNSDKSPSNYPQDDCGLFVNVYSLSGNIEYLAGVNNPSVTLRSFVYADTTRHIGAINQNSSDLLTTTHAIGLKALFGSQRSASNLTNLIKDGSIVFTGSTSSTGRTTRSQYFMARDDNGTLTQESTSTCNIFIQGIQSLDANGIADLNECITNYNNTIISGGR